MTVHFVKKFTFCNDDSLWYIVYTNDDSLWYILYQ